MMRRASLRPHRLAAISLRADGNPDARRSQSRSRRCATIRSAPQIIGNLSPSDRRNGAAAGLRSRSRPDLWAELTLENHDAAAHARLHRDPAARRSQLWQRAPADLPRCPTAG